MALQGYIDMSQPELVFGWAWNSDQPEKRLELDIYLDDTLLGRVVADSHREDLEEAGLGDGAYGFNFEHPALTEEAVDRVSVIVADTDFSLTRAAIPAPYYSTAPHRAPSLASIVNRTGALKRPDFCSIYETLLEPLRFMPLSLLELGIHRGGSLKTWARYFPFARIAGVDLRPPALSLEKRVRMFAGDQADTTLLARIGAEIAPEGFDVIIDDGAHIGAIAKASFWYLFDNHLKPGGWYFIEDWETGYSASWPDGASFSIKPDSAERMPSHDAGMVGFIKQLVDEIHAFPQDAPRLSRFSSITLQWGMCIVRKATRVES